MTRAVLFIFFVAIAGAGAAQAPVAPEEWHDDFAGSSLDAAKWEAFTFEGEPGARVEVRGGQLRLRGKVGARSGVRTRRMFISDRYLLEATLAQVGPALPEAKELGIAEEGPRAPEPEPQGKEGIRKSIGPLANQPPGWAILTLLFDDAGKNRIEWILRTDNTFEAWAVLNDRGERLDLNNIGTRVRNPRLGIERRGDVFRFLVNGQVGLEKIVRNVPRAFRVFLYGFSSSQNDWDALRVSLAGDEQ